MRHALVVTLLAAAALASCDKAAEEQMGLTNWQKAPPLLAGPDEGGAVMAQGAGGMAAGPQGAGSPAVGGAPTAPIPAAAPGTVPVRKAGLWQTTVNNGRGPAQTGQLCVDAQTELRRGVFSQGGRGGGQGCEPKITKTATGWTSTMSCTRSFGENSMKVSASQTLTGDLNSRYQLKGASSTSGGPGEDMNGTRNTSATGVYQGVCPAGMKPGDFKGADGEIRNVMAQGQGRGPGGGPGGGRREGGRRDGGSAGQ